MNVKELFENEELMDSIVADIEDIPEDSEVTYEVWALGYDVDDDCTDDEVLIGEFTDPDEAVACAEKATIEQINELGFGKPDPTTAYFSIEVETVVEDPEDEGTMNIGTIYSRDLWLDGEHGSVEDAEPTIFIYSKDYELLKDGTLKVRRELLKDYNKNDCVKLYFAEEESCTLTYKIISKVEYADGDYYHLEFIG
jgi:hypothetical protein